MRSAFPGGAVLSVIAALLIGVHGPVAWIAFSISAVIALGCVAIFVLLREASHEIEDGSASVRNVSADSTLDAVENGGRPALGGPPLAGEGVAPGEGQPRERSDAPETHRD